jgi:hypothetical protein
VVVSFHLLVIGEEVGCGADVGVHGIEVIKYVLDQRVCRYMPSMAPTICCLRALLTASYWLKRWVALSCASVW